MCGVVLGVVVWMVVFYYGWYGGWEGSYSTNIPRDGLVVLLERNRRKEYEG